MWGQETVGMIIYTPCGVATNMDIESESLTALEKRLRWRNRGTSVGHHPSLRPIKNTVLRMRGYYFDREIKAAVTGSLSFPALNNPRILGCVAAVAPGAYRYMYGWIPSA